jgi:ParB/RepB/Spo0J family partition protein
MPEFKRIPLADLVPPDVPMRFEMGDQAMLDLVESIQSAGILEPLLVVPWYTDAAGARVRGEPITGQVGPATPTCYEVRDGHRRYTAATHLKLADVPCMVFPNSDDSNYLIMLHANVVREDVTPVEEGVLFLELANKHGWSMDQLVRHFHKSENYINERVDLCQCDPAVSSAVASRTINLSQAKQILRAGDAGFRTYLLDQAVTHGANARTLHQMIANHAQEQSTAQGNLHVNTPEFATPVESPETPRCIWCRETTDVQHMRQVWVHWFHQRDLEAVVETLGVHNLRKQAVPPEG